MIYTGLIVANSVLQTFSAEINDQGGGDEAKNEEKEGSLIVFSEIEEYGYELVFDENDNRNIITIINTHQSVYS